MRLPPIQTALFILLALVPVARAEVHQLVVLQREPFAGGTPFGDTGPYEKITGIVRYRVDPNHSRNQVVIDLHKAARNGDGRVEFESDFVLLAPKDPTKGNGAVLYDVNNRGNKLALGMFNDAVRGNNNPRTIEDAGNGYLFRRGYSVIWCGWIGEVLPGNDRLLLRLPVATENGQPIRGLARFETSSDTPSETLPLARREGLGSYAPTPQGEKEGVLTWRLREDGPRVPIPREQWSLEQVPLPKVERGVQSTMQQIRLKLAGGFRPGYIYELICECEGPIVQGLGFVAVRDLVSFLKYDLSQQNPLCAKGQRVIQRAHGFGVSQSGRFLRNFLYLGFNGDEMQRRVFDGLMPHVAGGGLGYFNFRFAQPTRHNGQHEEHSYPADYFPFTYGDDVDPFTKRTDGILKRTRFDGERFMPKVMHTQGAAEYWHRSGSLVHTNPLGTKDAEIPDNVRIYAFGGTQHGPAADPPGRGPADNLNNPGDYRPLLRALLEALEAWTRDGTAPPASVYPRIAEGTLVAWQQERTGFPAIPGVRYPEVIQQPAYRDYGPEFETRGLITVEPPRIRGHYVVRVPLCRPDGNEQGTLLVPDVAVPLATYTGWNLRRRDVGAEAQLASLLGSYIPFPVSKAERQASGDPRSSIEERYGTFTKYQQQFAGTCADMVKQRYLLQEDADRLIQGRDKLRERFPADK